MNWVRPQIQKLYPYIPGKQITGNVIKLNANENPYPPSPKVLQALKNISFDGLRLYPDALSTSLRKTAAEIYNLNYQQIIAGNGSDDVLTMIIRTFIDVNDYISVVEPTYTLYETLANIQGGKVEKHLLNEDYSLPVSFFNTKSKIVFLPNPNAQTGTLFPQEQIEALCKREENIVVIDEAYADFAGATAIPLINKYENIIILKTLSKSYSLAGIRVGFGLANKNIINSLMKVKDSYNVNAVSQIIAQAALLDQQYLKENIKKINNTRDWFAKELTKLKWKVTPSVANFLLVEPPNAAPQSIMKKLEKHSILIRYFDTPTLNNKLRISIGTYEQMEKMLQVIKNNR